jgi:hypothetical protein
MFATALLLCAQLVGAPGPRFNIDQLADGLARLDDAFNPGKSVYVIEFATAGTYHGGGRDGAPRTVRKVSVIGRKQDKIYAHVVQTDTGLGESSTVWLVWDGKVFSKKEGMTVDYFRYILPQTLNHFEYPRSLFLDTLRYIRVPGYDGVTPAGGRSTEDFWNALPRMVVENRGHYRVRPRLEQIDGAWCHVLEWPDYDVIWIDAERSFVPRRREARLRGHLRSVTLNRELAQRRPGLWLPGLQETTTYIIPGIVSDRLKPGDVVYEQTTRLNRAKFGGVDDSFFKVPIAPEESLLVHDGVRQMTYMKHAANYDPIQAAVRDMNLHKVDRASSGSTILYLVNATVMGLLLGALLARQLIAKRRPAVGGAAA